MIKRTIEISSGAARLSIHNRQLVIDRQGHEPATVAAEDLGLLLVDHPAVTFTHAVFTALAESGAAVVLCGANHMPSVMMMPLASNSIQTERFGAQIAAGAPLKKQLWRQIIAAKLSQQGAVLESVSGADGGLRAMARRVRSGDEGNLEAQAAQRYWPKLLGPDFRRGRDGDPPNNLLNYGYGALRATVARALCAAGLLPTLGIHHRNRYNAFCLADDLMEPFRPFVDLRVVELFVRGEPPAQLGRNEKAQLLGLFNDRVRIADRVTPLSLAIHSTAASLARSFAERRAALALPKGLPALGDEEGQGGENDEGAEF